MTRRIALPDPLFAQTALILFVLSGLAGLIYQSVWAHYLGLLLGNAAYAQALVLATFMGGMGLGGWLAARHSIRWRRLIRVYAVVEILLGFSGLLFHSGFVLLHDPLMGLDSGLRWLVAALMILPQSVLLGISFPVMSAGLMRRLGHERGRILGNLYFSNSAGAAVGALIATFLLLPRIGLPGSLQFAGLINLLIGVLAWLIGSRPDRAIGTQPTRCDSPRKESTWSEQSRGRSLLAIVLMATCLSSAASFVYEIAWIRMLSLAVGSTLHAFELMLAAFIGGMALGGLWIRHRADRYGQPLQAAGWIQFTMGAAAVLSLAVYASGAFEWVGFLSSGLAKTDAGYSLYNAGTAAAAIAVMLPAAFFAGATLPLFTAILLRLGQSESVIGKVYAWNTLGAIGGVLLAIHLLIPAMGLRNAVLVAAAVDMLIGAVLLGLGSGRRMTWRPAVIAAAVGIFLLIGGRGIEFDPLKLASGVFRSGAASLSSGSEMVYYRDGKTASVALYIDESGQYGHIANNGKVDAALNLGAGMPTGDEPTMVLAGALPLMLHDSPERIAVIGMGSGLTTHTLLADDRAMLVETIEIEPRMVEAARLFGPRVERVWKDARSSIVIDDAKAFLAGPLAPYDVIVSEPSNPWMSGVGSLFADEFYAYIRQRLAADGLFVQWLQLYEIDEDLVGSVLAAITPHFEHFRAWMANDSDLLLVASAQPISEPEMSILASPALARELELAGLQSMDQLRLRQFGDELWLKALSRSLSSAANSYFLPRLSLEAPRTRFKKVSASRLIETARQQPIALQMLGIGGSMEDQDAASASAHFTAEQRTVLARRKLEVLQGYTADLTGVAIADQAAFDRLQLLKAWSVNCSIFDQPSGTSRWLEVYAETVGTTLPYLSTEAARGLHAADGWLNCDQPPPAVLSAFELVAILATRDPALVTSAASNWLDLVLEGKASGAYLTDSAYLAGQAALIARGEMQEAARFRNWYAATPPLDGLNEWLNAVMGEYLLLELKHVP